MRTLIALTALIAGITAHALPVRQGPRVLNANEQGVGRRIDDVAFKSIDGRGGRLADYRDRKALVIAFTGVGCPLTRKFAPLLAELEGEFTKRGVAFIYVNPIDSDDASEQLALAKDVGFSGPVVHDVKQDFARALQPETTTEVFVLDAARTLVYRGAVSDQFGIGYAHDAPRNAYLRDALEAVLQGYRPRVAATWSPGCALDPVESKAAPVGDITYHNRVSRIVQSNCVECHRKGGVAPFSLTTYRDVVGNAGMIRRVVSDGLMPPWFAAPGHGEGESPWANDRSLPTADKADLLAWLKNGRPEGDPKDAPLPMEFPEGWNIGEPDHLVALPRAVSVKATGRMPYVNLFVKTDFKEDRWVSAAEIRPTFPEVVHHVLVFVIPPSESGQISRRDLSREDRGFLAAYVPGNSFEKHDPGFAKRLPAGSTLHFQMHYTPNGRAVRDQTQLGLKFLQEAPENLITVTGIADHRFRIPPHANNYSSSKTLDVPVDVALTGFMAHMHLRGKAFRYDLIDPSGKRETLLDIPAYDFNWQLKYEYAEPRLVSAGSRIEVTGWFDNSADNPANPDPDKTVKWGPQTEDEMLLGYVEYYIPGAGVSDPASALAKNGAGSDLARRFRELDKNRDGLITPAELPQPALFAALDEDGNDEVSLLEAGNSLRNLATGLGDKNLRTKTGSDYVMRLFNRLDRNRDDRLTQDEVTRQLKARVAKADLDRDGVLTRAELERALQRRP